MTARSSRKLAVPALAIGLLLLTADAAYAYGGPGSIISGIGALLAALAAIGAAIFGFVWFPAKKLYKRLHGKQRSAEDPAREGAHD